MITFWNFQGKVVTFAGEVDTFIIWCEISSAFGVPRNIENYSDLLNY